MMKLSLKQRIHRKNLAMFICLLMVLSMFASTSPPPVLADPPTAGSIISPSVTPDISTLNASTTYNISFTLGTNITVATSTPDTVIVLDSFNSSYDLSGLLASDVTLKDNDNTIAADVTWDAALGRLLVSPGAAIAANDIVTVSIPGVKNPTSTGNYNFASIHLESQTSPVTTSNYEDLYANITVPTLVISPDTLNMDVNMRDKITIGLRDSLGAPLAAPSDFSTYIYTNNSGEFYPREADVYSNDYFTIPAGQSSATIYYRPTSAGTHQFTVYSEYYNGGYIANAYSQSITVNPTPVIDANSFVRFGNSQYSNSINSTVAGEPVQVQLRLYCKDQEGRLVDPTQDVTVNISAFSAYGTDEQAVPGTVKLLQADASGNLATPDTLITQVTIPKDGLNKGIGYFYFKDTRATTSDYRVTLEAQPVGMETQSCIVNVDPAPSTQVKIAGPDSGNNISTGQRLELNVQLLDTYGNLADPQPPSLTVMLASSSITGRFYEDQWTNTPLDRITFSQGWSYYDSKKTVYYTNTAASATPDTITATASYLTPGQVQVPVTTAPTLTVTAPAGDLEVMLFKELTLQLTGADGQPLVAGDGGVNLNLHTDKTGYFYAQPSDNQLAIYSVPIPAGESSVKVFYRANKSVTGIHTITVDTSAFGGIAASPLAINVVPAAQTGSYLSMSTAGSFTAGKPGKVDISYNSYDQHSNPIPQAADLLVNLSAFNGCSTVVTPDTFRFYACDAAGNAATPDVLTVNIPKDTGSASFYFSDTRATSSNYYEPAINARASGAEGTLWVDVYPDKVDSITVEPEQNNQTIDEVFPIKVSLYDQYQNLANPQYQPLTVDLTSKTAAGGAASTGTFYNSSYLNTPITQLIFQYSSDSEKTVYFKASTADTITITASTVNTTSYVANGTATLTVRPAAQLSIIASADPVEVNIYKKFTVKLAENAPADTSIQLSSNQPGSFYTQPAGNSSPVYSVTIPTGSNSMDVYYQSDVVGTHTLQIFTSSFGGVSSDPVDISVVPAGQVVSKLILSTNSSSCIAGQKIPINVDVKDQYNNLVPQASPLTVELEAAQPDGRPVSSSSSFFAADSEGNAAATTLDTLVIPAGASSGLFYYYDETATTGVSTATDPGYSLEIKAHAQGISSSELPIYIWPGMAKQVEINPVRGTKATNLSGFPLLVSLLDQYGNLAQEPSNMISLDLVSSSSSGRFFEVFDRNAPNLDHPVAQLNFQNTSQRFVIYNNDIASTTPDTITISTTDMIGASVDLTVTEPPVITLTAQSVTPEVNLFNKITINLDSAAEEDLTLNLSNSSAGAFYLNASNNDSAIGQVVIPAGSTSLDFWYRPANVGIDKIAAFIDYPRGKDTSNEVELTVQPAGQVVFGHLNMTVPAVFVAGQPGKVVLDVTDQYNNPVKQPAGGLEVKLEGAQLSGEPLSAAAKFFKVNGDGSVSTQDTTTVTIPEGQSSAEFYYYDEKATVLAPSDPTYNIAISASADNLEDCVLPVKIMAAPAYKADIVSTNGIARPVYDQFDLRVQLLDKFGNCALPQTEPVTVDLTSNTTTGRFYSAQNQRITQVTFLQASSTSATGQIQQVYFVDSEPGNTITLAASAPNLTTGELMVKALPMPKAIKINFGSNNWLIKQRGLVKVSLFADEAATTYYQVPADLADGLNISLSSNPAGRFYDAVVEGNELPEGVLNIKAGTEVKDLPVYFAPDASGDVEISVGITYAGHSYSGPGGKADIVWVLDHSGSMTDDQQNIANNINAFANQLLNSGVDYRLGFVYYADNVITRENFGSDLFTQDTSAFSSQLITVSQSCNGSGEVTMGAVQDALGYPFIGTKNIIIVTDEPGDDNAVYAATQAAVDAAGAKVYAVWEDSVASISMIDELADTSGGLQIPITGEWSDILSTLASSIISGTTQFDITTSDTIKVSAAGGVRAVLIGSREFIAGQPGKVTLSLIDQYNDLTTWPVDLKVDLRAVLEDETYSSTGKFYAAAGDGSIVAADTIDSVIIPKNTDSLTIYYQDTRADSPDYNVQLQTSSSAVEGYRMPIVITAGATNHIDIKTLDWSSYSGLTIDNTYGSDLWIPGLDDEQHNVLSGMIFPVQVSIMDQNGNPVAMSTPLTVNLSSNIVLTTPDNLDVTFYADNSQSFPITQVTIPAETQTVTIFMRANGIGNETLRGQAAELGSSAEGTWAINVLPADRLKIVFPGETPDENGVFPVPEVQPEGAKAFYVLLTDSEGHPSLASRDIEVKLSGDSNGTLSNFYQDQLFFTPVTDNVVTIKKGSHGVMVWVKGARAEGTMTIQADDADTSPILTGSGAITIKVASAPYYYRELKAGWNILSTPVQLDPNYASLNVIVGTDELIESAYAWDSSNSRWVQVYKDGTTWRIQEGNAANTSSDSTTGEDPEFALQPWQAVYVKLDGSGMARYYPYHKPSGPYTLTLKKGWNLFGPSLDVNTDWAMPVDDALTAINGTYSQVISPGIGWQDPWSYVPGSSYDYYNQNSLKSGYGYWIYMNEDNRLLPGFGYTPVSECYCWSNPSINSSVHMSALVETNSPPPLPGAYYGVVKYSDGTAVSAGTIEAMIDGVVYGSAEIKDGRFGAPDGARLLVQYVNDYLGKKVEFLVNGIKADQTANWPYDSGEVVSLSLTVGIDNAAPEFRDFSIDASGKVITLNFSEMLQSNVTDLKSTVKISTDGINFNNLGSADTATVTGKSVVINLASPLSGNDSRIMIAANSLKDLAGNVLNTAVNTEARDTQIPGFEKALFDSSDKQTVTLQFSEYIYDNTGNNLKGAISIARDGTNFEPLDDGDQVTIKDNTLIITFITPISGNNNRIKVASAALKDASGNQTAEVTTGSITAEGCFIATAAYGSYLNPHVWALRQFRDNILMHSAPGRWFVAAYYKNSPVIAAYIAQHDSLRLLTRILLTPLVLAVEYPLLALVLLLFLLALVIRKRSHHGLANAC